MAISGAELIARALKQEGVKKIFAYPGGAAMDLFDALYETEDYDIILPRHEQGLAHAADGYARATGDVGVCLTTSGPGATNLVTGIATAYFDSVPLVCLTGQVATHLIGNDAFQEVDFVGITRGITKYTTTVQRREDLATELKKAFIVARTGRPGPVVVDIPKNIQTALGSSDYPETLQIKGYRPNKNTHMGQVKRAISLLQEASRPLLLIGGGVRISQAEEELLDFVERSRIPVVTTMMGKGCLDTKHPYYIGNIGMHGLYAANWAVNRCDLLLSIGCRFSDRILGKEGTFAARATIVHIDIDPASISRNLEVDIPIVGDARDALKKINDRLDSVPDWSTWYEQIVERKVAQPITMGEPDQLTPENIIKALNEVFEGSTRFTTDVGQNQLWASQYLELSPERTMFCSGGLGTMGYGLPAAIGTQLADPDSHVICITGDGGFQMNIQELTTAVMEKLPVVICLLNNAFLGNVRQWQTLFYQRRYAWTMLGSDGQLPEDIQDIAQHPVTQQQYLPDFMKVTQAFGLEGRRITQYEELRPALEWAKSRKESPTLLEFLIKPEANVYPMTVPGQPIDIMMFKEEEDEV